jgi:glycerol-3-phosphate acyltransferase PlsX
MASNKIRVALDAMGGDYAPQAVVQGSLLALQEAKDEIDLILVGDKGEITSELNHSKLPLPPLDIKHAPQSISMEEQAMEVIRKKKDSSIAIGMKLLKEKEVDAFVSGGNTGVVMATALFKMGRIEGVARPAIASCLPSEKGIVVVLDVGANAECKPQNLYQFALMGSIYCNYVLKVKNPKIGLLSIGQEDTKGNELILDTNKLLSRGSLNFVGNVEGRDVLKGTCDVVVCDGFVGNIVLKFAESIDGFLVSLVRKRVKESILFRLGAFLLKVSLRDLKKSLDYAEYGGAPLLGVDGVCIICHGDSSPKAIKNAIKLACNMVKNEVNSHIKERIAQNSHMLKEAHEQKD